MLTPPRWYDLAVEILNAPIPHCYCCLVQTVHLLLYKDTRHRQSRTQFHQLPQTPQLYFVTSPADTHVHMPAPYFFGDASHVQNAS